MQQTVITNATKKRMIKTNRMTKTGTGIILFNSLKSAKDPRDPLGFLIVNIGQAHSDLLIFLNMPC